MSPARRHTLRIGSEGVGGAVHLDGHDISNALAGVSLHMKSGHLPTAVLDVYVHEMPTGDVREAHVDLPPATRDLLVRLGWTPPVKEATDGAEA